MIQSARFSTTRGCWRGWGVIATRMSRRSGSGTICRPRATGRGITDAFHDAELVADAIVSGLDGGPPLAQTLAEYQARRDTATLPMYEMTLELASFVPPRPEQRMLMSALAGNHAETDRFLGVLGGMIPPGEYLTPRNMLRLIGVRGVLQAIRSRRRMQP